MNQNHKLMFQGLSIVKGKNLLLIAIFALYLSLFGSWIREGGFPLSYGTDYLAFWSIGKIADEKGYSEIYDLDNLEYANSRTKGDGFNKKYRHAITFSRTHIFFLCTSLSTDHQKLAHYPVIGSGRCLTWPS